MTTDYSKAIKRLELIKNLILLEEVQEIEEQISRLKQLEIDNGILEIINLLNDKSYGNAIKNIEEYIQSNLRLTLYIDPQVEALRLEAKTLEIEIQNLSNEKAELDKLVHEFSIRYNQELGELIIKILEFRKQNAQNSAEREEADKDYQEFHTNYEATKGELIVILSDDEKKELKDKYRKASKLCHPDVVEENYKEEAHKIFTELNDAYDKNDLMRVNEILTNLQKGVTFTSKADSSDETELLNKEVVRLKEKLSELNKIILSIKSSKTFENIQSISDWDAYFSETKKQLFEQLKEVQGNGK